MAAQVQSKRGRRRHEHRGYERHRSLIERATCHDQQIELLSHAPQGPPVDRVKARGRFYTAEVIQQLDLIRMEICEQQSRAILLHLRISEVQCKRMATIIMNLAVVIPYCMYEPPNLKN
jgi:hypothetical protein